MKTLLNVRLFALLLIGSFMAAAQADACGNKAKMSYEEIQLKTDATDQAKLESSLKKVSFVKSAMLDTDNKIVTIKYNADDACMHGVQNAVKDAGFKADFVKTDAQGCHDKSSKASSKGDCEHKCGDKEKEAKSKKT